MKNNSGEASCVPSEKTKVQAGFSPNHFHKYIPRVVPIWAWVLLGALPLLIILMTDLSGTSLAISISAILATLGWVVSANINQRSARKQHTFNILLQLRHSEMYNKHVADLSKFAKQECPDGEINFVPWSKIEQAGAVSDDILYVANHFEFIAVGIYSGDLDEGILKGFIRGTICHTVILAGRTAAKAIDEYIRKR